VVVEPNRKGTATREWACLHDKRTLIIRFVRDRYRDCRREALELLASLMILIVGNYYYEGGRSTLTYFHARATESETGGRPS
jgi:hypothetical protein